jgi:hypothetical protein
MENLVKVGGSQQRLDAVESCLWRGDAEAAVRQFEGWSQERVDRFISYLTHHTRLWAWPQSLFSSVY